MEDLALLRAKLYRPPLVADLVPHPRLLERLHRRRQRPLILEGHFALNKTLQRD